MLGESVDTRNAKFQSDYSISISKEIFCMKNEAEWKHTISFGNMANFLLLQNFKSDSLH